ncbi:MAG: 1-acyl-sn-glycerol-3-phosphate acyltransferase [Alphaproteobacteria bacterium]|nr:1-acyl-sn-glycerol-3-phosphate acyltransferase [Alphaproteobacteria bacterium]
MSAPSNSFAYGSRLRAALRAAGLTLLILITLILYPVINPLPRRWKLGYAQGFFRVARFLFGVKLLVRGTPRTHGPTLFTSNHSSYLDIILISTAVRTSFIAKGEIEGWPLINRLCELQDTLFVTRKAALAAKQRDTIRARLEQGDNLVLFPEGTTSDGNRVLPFKSSLFATVMEPTAHGPVMVQPVSIIATALDGIPLGRTLRPIYAWYGDMTLGKHVWPLLQAGQITVELEFHEPVASNNFARRRELSDYCWTAVNRGAMRALTGREPQHLLTNQGAGAQKQLAAPAPDLAQITPS